MATRDEINKRWEKRWEIGNMPWHMNEVNPFLKEFFHRFDGDFDNKRVFVPLCGKALELKWLYDKGMCVVGVELSELGVKSFFEENNLSYQVDECPDIPDAKIYRHDDRLSIFVCDVFKVNASLLGGACDYLWDRGAFKAMVYDEQQKYADMLDSVLSNKAQGLVELIEYDRALYPGPSYSILEDELLQFIDGKFCAEKLSAVKNSDLPEWYRTDLPSLKESIRTIYFIKRDV